MASEAVTQAHIDELEYIIEALEELLGLSSTATFQESRRSMSSERLIFWVVALRQTAALPAPTMVETSSKKFHESKCTDALQ